MIFTGGPGIHHEYLKFLTFYHLKTSLFNRKKKRKKRKKKRSHEHTVQRNGPSSSKINLKLDKLLSTSFAKKSTTFFVWIFAKRSYHPFLSQEQNDTDMFCPSMKHMVFGQMQRALTVTMNNHFLLLDSKIQKATSLARPSLHTCEADIYSAY